MDNREDLRETLNETLDALESLILRETLNETLDALESLMNEANLGASFLTADTIRKINEVPFKARRALRSDAHDETKGKR